MPLIAEAPLAGPKAAATFHALRIAEIRRETENAVSIALAVPDRLGAVFAYAPGQYLTLRANLGGEEVRRAYSICSGPDDALLRIAVKRAPGGLFSGHATTALAVGQSVDVLPPAGRFGASLEPTAARVHVAIAAGSGITPILSILRHGLASEPRSRFVLLYGSRSTREILFRDALEDLKDRYLDRLSVIHVLSREAQDVAVLNGRLDAAKIAALLPSAVDPARVDHVYLCGPSGMIDTVAAAVEALGVPAARIHSERFTPAGEAVRPARAVSPVVDPIGAPAFAMATVIHDGTTTQVPVAAGEPVLDAALRAGLDLPWSCRGGMCSTCRARLTEGEARMTENFSLEPWELAAGFVLTCQAHPISRTLVVDYDQV